MLNNINDNIFLDVELHDGLSNSPLDKIGSEFKDIMDSLEKMESTGADGEDLIKLQHDLTEYSILQEIVTKVVSKSATAINEVLKSQ